MALIIADTDVLIDFLHGKGPGAEWVGREIEKGTLRTTTITQFELLSGARTPKDRERVQLLLSLVDPVPFTALAAEYASSMRRSLEQAGQGIGTADSLIAGIVQAHSARLMTRDQAHFGRIEDLPLF